MVFFVKDAAAAPVVQVGPMIEHHRLFPEGVNVGFAEVQGRDRIRPAGVGARRRPDQGLWHGGLRGRRRRRTGAAWSTASARWSSTAGPLRSTGRESDGHVIMTGPVEVEFTGQI